MEDSDGISVISESEMYKHQTSDTEIEKATIPEEIDEVNFEPQEDAKNNENEEKVQDSDLIAPTHVVDECSQMEVEQHVTSLKRFEKSCVLKEMQESAQQFQKSNHAVLVLIVVSLVIAILYTNVTSLKNELARTVAIYEQRILRLEEENQLLRTQLDELMTKLKSPRDTDTFSKHADTKPAQQLTPKVQVHVMSEKNIVQKPITRNVWLGGEKEEVVKVLDKKYNSLPDYCYFTDENDLFYEYNMENCEKMKQKRDERTKKFNNQKYLGKENEFVADKDTGSDKFNVDDIWKSSDKVYNDFMSKTADEILKSLTDEIQEIKGNRVPMTNKDENVVNDNAKYDKTPFTKEKNKNFEGKGNGSDKKWKDKRENNFDTNQPQKRMKQEHVKNWKQGKDNKGKNDKDGSSGDWSDQRSKARQDARMKKDTDENWYLKRKNERELHRLDTFRN